MAGSGRVCLWYLIGSLQIGGANRTLVDLANELDPTRFHVTVWTLLDRNPLSDDLRPEVTHRSLDATGKLDVRAVVEFLRATRRKRPDILQSFLFFDNILARLAGLASPNTVIISGIRVVPGDSKLHRVNTDRLTVRFADHFVSNSEAGRHLAIERGVSPERVTVIPNGRDLSTYASATPSPDLRLSLGIPEVAKLVGTVGRLVERKGGFDLLDAWPAVRKAQPDAHLLFVGDGPERNRLEDHARKLDCRDSVTFAGTRQDVPELLAAMDVFAFPSHFEGLPGAVIEAMAAGLPIVATRVHGTDELISHGETGILVPVRDSEALADALDRVLADQKLAVDLGRNAATVACERFSLDRMTSDFESLYDSLLGE